MEYFIAAVCTLGTLVAFNKMVQKKAKVMKLKEIKFRQSHTHEMLKGMIPIADLMPSFGRKINTQASKHFDRVSTRILFIDSKAWWISDNTLYSADIIEGNFDKESGEKVDTMTMDKVQLDKTIFIVEKLTEGLNNDRGSSR
jgi:hypothetical protein